jgi:hypothetical protein
MKEFKHAQTPGSRTMAGAPGRTSWSKGVKIFGTLLRGLVTSAAGRQSSLLAPGPQSLGVQSSKPFPAGQAGPGWNERMSSIPY